MKDVLVLFSFRAYKLQHNINLFNRLSAAAAAWPLNLHRGSLKDMHISITDNRLVVKDALTDRDISSFDALYFELWGKAYEQALAVATYAKRHNVPFLSGETAHVLPKSKIGDMALLADNDIPLPQTFISSHREIKRVFASDAAPFSFPLVIKDADGHGGQINFLVHDYAELRAVLDNPEHKKVFFVVQALIPNDCDYRCLVIGGQIRVVLKRTRAADAGTHLNNTSQGAEGTVVPVESLSEEARRDVLKAAHVLNREQFTGIDLLINKETGKHYILESNKAPEIETGAETDKKTAALLGYIHALATGEAA